MSELEVLQPRWDGPIIVAATGKSLTKEVAEACMASGRPIIAIKQAVLRLPTADVLYACDAHHWDAYQGYPQFKGERWSTHGKEHYDNKLAIAKKYRVRLVHGRHGKSFSSDPAVIHYGNNTGLQAIGLAIHWMRKPGRIVLVGLDLRGGYFFGRHPRWGTNDPPLGSYARYYEEAAKALPEGIEIINASPISSLRCFKMVGLNEALSSSPTP